jgi:MYXO-CTERM domain-containing protein
MSRRVTILAGLLCLSVATLPTAARATAEPDAPRSERPRGTYVFRAPVDGKVAPIQPQHAGTPHTLFLNRCPGGITLLQAAEDNSSANQSSIVTGSISLNEYPFGDAAWTEVVAGVREIFSPFGITVTDIDPTPATHDEVIVCGSDVAAGFDGAAGVAPYTCGPITDAITFTFPETIGNDARFTIETIAQEAAHAWGLDHEFKCEDPMTYLLDCGDKSFQQGDYPCGEYEARACQCGGNTQNSYAHILALFGNGTPDTQQPLASITYPADGDRFAPGDDFDLTISVSDDVEVRRVFLYAAGEQSASDESSPFEGWRIDDIPAGTHELYIEAEDAAGNLGISDVVTIVVGDVDGGEDASEGEGTGELGSDDGGADDGLDGGAMTSASGDAIPAGFGRDAETSGCGCTSTSPASSAPGWLALLWAAARRRRARPVLPD